MGEHQKVLCFVSPTCADAQVFLPVKRRSGKPMNILGNQVMRLSPGGGAITI
ncbi:hypothetical protein [Erwinia sp. E_sp_W01_6]|uniref:hypothetical protein n=1 Tax=unclassified Erwinia TaxID=2622719 RepID=UPI0030D0D49D